MPSFGGVTLSRERNLTPIDPSQGIIATAIPDATSPAFELVSTPENGKGTWKRVDLDPVPAATDSTAEAAPSALTSSPVPAGAKPE